MTERLLTCALCHTEFKPAWSEEEAVAELEQNFNNIPKEDCVVVCDICWKQLPQHMKSIHG